MVASDGRVVDFRDISRRAARGHAARHSPRHISPEIITFFLSRHISCFGAKDERAGEMSSPPPRHAKPADISRHAR